MANEKFTQLPTVVSSTMGDIIAAVQGGVSSQETLQQVFNLFLANCVLHNAGDPNGSVTGVVYQLCWDTSNNFLYICTTSGNATTAVWERAGSTPTATNSSVLGSTSAGVPTWIGPLTNGQLIIGSTGATPVAATITAGTNISIVNAAGAITISATGLGGFSWTTVTGTSHAMLPNNGYITNNAGLVTLSLPATSAVGDEIDIIGRGAGGWAISQGAGQSIVVGSSTTTVGVGGSLASTNAKDSFYMICIVANTTWQVGSAPQSAGLTIV